MMDLRSSLMKLVLDPRFAAYERIATRPNLFRIVGRTHTETWHSTLLGWLLDPRGSHGLEDFPLRRLLLAAVDHSLYSPAALRSSLMKVAALGDFGAVRVVPNERERKERPIRLGDRSGRLDVFVSGIATGDAAQESAVVLLEQKVYAPPDSDQCRFYKAWLDHEHPGALHVPILLAPVEASEGRPVDDERWFVMNYQSLHDHVLVPVLEHAKLAPFARSLVEQYVDTLRIPMNGIKLAFSNEELDLANKLYERHKATFQALFHALTQVDDDPRIEALSKGTVAGERQPIVIRVGDATIRGTTGADFLRRVTNFLAERDLLERVIPYQTGRKRYLAAWAPTHLSGKDFEAPSKVALSDGRTVFVETNASRPTALKYAIGILQRAGFEPEVVVESGEG